MTTWQKTAFRLRYYWGVHKRRRSDSPQYAISNLKRATWISTYWSLQRHYRETNETRTIAKYVDLGYKQL